jgi:ParB/Sulfiredoxin domain
MLPTSDAHRFAVPQHRNCKRGPPVPGQRQLVRILRIHAESILQVGLQSPILVRQDGERFVLVEGLHRLEACKQLGEETIVGYVVQARRH